MGDFRRVLNGWSGLVGRSGVVALGRVDQLFIRGELDRDVVTGGRAWLILHECIGCLLLGDEFLCRVVKRAAVLLGADEPGLARQRLADEQKCEPAIAKHVAAHSRCIPERC